MKLSRNHTTILMTENTFDDHVRCIYFFFSIEVIT